MIKPFEYFKREGLVEKTAQNISLAKSLLAKAKIRLNRILNEDINEDNASLIFEDAYEVVREAAQALMQLERYKPLSHEALIAFLAKNKYLSEEKINVIDKYRILRNRSVYGAEKVSIEKCKESVKFARDTLPVIESKFKELTT